MTQPGDTPAPATTPESTSEPATPSWTDGLSEDQSGFLSNKGFTDAGALLTSYQHLVRHLRAPAERQLTLPSADAAPDEWNAIWHKLGAPETAEGYEFASAGLPEGVEDVMTPWFREQAFKHHIPAEAAKALQADYMRMQTEAISARNTELNERDQQGMVELQKKWGAAYEEKRLQARRFIETVLTEEEENFFQDNLGESWLTEFGSRLGTGLGEPAFAAGGRARGGEGKMSPGEARAALKELRTDEDFMVKWRAGNVEARGKLRRLTEFATPPTEGGAPPTFDPLA